MGDFTLIVYRNLLETLVSQKYSFITFSNYLGKNKNIDISSKIILRHDVEEKYENALQFAQIQNELGVLGTYFFRILPKYFNPEIVKQIAELGHEVGYHYDDLTKCKGNHNKAILRFKKNLNILRDISPLQTICMDGSPLSSYDNKDLWSHYNYNDYGILGEPYFDIEFDEIFYLTDTGRRWDGWKTSVRDKVPQQEDWIKQGLIFHSTEDIINAIQKNYLPNQVLFTMHPQRWHNKSIPWLKELVLQNVKNQIKIIIIRNKLK